MKKPGQVCDDGTSTRRGRPARGAFLGLLLGSIAAVVVGALSVGGTTRVAYAIGPTSAPIATTVTIDRRLVGEHCVAGDPIAFQFDRYVHTESEVRAHRSLARRVEATRLHVGRDGTVRVIEPGGLTRTGRFVSVEGTGDEQTLGIDWQGEPPTGPLLGGRRATFAWVDGDLVVTGNRDIPLIMLVPPDSPACMAIDDAWVLNPAAPTAPTPASVHPPEPWASQDPARWPQLVLTNQATFRASSAHNRASSFLVSSEGRVLLATALHLIGQSGGVAPQVSLAAFDYQLTSWTSFVRTRPSPAVTATSLAMLPVTDDDANDWLLLRTRPRPARTLPSRPIALREVAAALGERVFLVGCEYRDPRCTQTVVGGRVTGRNARRLRLALDHPVMLRGYSGAPIVDAIGHAVGVLSTSAGFDLPDESSVEAEGSGATHALGLLISRSTR